MYTRVYLSLKKLNTKSLIILVYHYWFGGVKNKILFILLLDKIVAEAERLFTNPLTQAYTC